MGGWRLFALSAPSGLRHKSVRCNRLSDGTAIKGTHAQRCGRDSDSQSRPCWNPAMSICTGETFQVVLSFLAEIFRKIEYVFI